MWRDVGSFTVQRTDPFNYVDRWSCYSHVGGGQGNFLAATRPKRESDHLFKPSLEVKAWSSTFKTPIHLHALTWNTLDP
jgi:hypothetical protein